MHDRILVRISQGSWGRISLKTSIGISGDGVRLDETKQGAARVVEEREGELSIVSVGSLFTLIFFFTYHQLQLLAV